MLWPYVIFIVIILTAGLIATHVIDRHEEKEES